MFDIWGNQQSLLKHGAQIDARSALHWTALMCAASKGHVSVVQVTLDPVIHQVSRSCDILCFVLSAN